MSKATTDNELIYLELLADVLNYGTDLPDRTGTGRRSLFAEKMCFLPECGFPILTTKKVWFKGIVTELLWFLQGRTDISFLHEHGVHFWDEWVKPDGTFGPIYGKQMRDSGGVDQLAQVIDSLINNPYSRRHVISLWNPGDQSEMALPPCHGLVIQFFCDGETIDLAMYQRSADMFLGVPFNIASYSLLLHIVAAATGYDVGELTIILGDAHIYDNHFNQVDEQLSRVPNLPPQLLIDFDFDGFEDPLEAIMSLKPEHFQLVDYNHHPAISAPISV